jgi:formylmethanofuran:tetrahydromethanopterin formyltransferase
MSPGFGGLANKGNTEDIMKELKERREQKIMGKPEEKVFIANDQEEHEDHDKIKKFGNILIQGALKKRKDFR